MIFVRFLVAGAIMLPLLVRWGLPTLAGIGLKRACLLTALGGAPFALLQTGGYGFPSMVRTYSSVCDRFPSEELLNNLY